jgi:trehalose synthase
VVSLCEVPVPALPPQRLEEVLGRERLATFLQAAAQVRDNLDGAIIWNVNSTAGGGGVAEMLRALLPWARGSDINTRWLVVSGSPDFFAVTKRVHNHIYGFRGDGGPLGPPKRAVYERTLAENAKDLHALIRPGDVVILHGPQTVGLAQAMRTAGATVIWRCHIGRDTPNSLSEEGWAFLRPYIAAAHRVVLTRASFAPSWLSPEQMAVIPPSIDPFSPKNQPMTPEMVCRILVHTGLLQGSVGPEPLPVFLRPDGSPGRVDHHADTLQSGPPAAADVPLVVQISRWGHTKDMGGVMRAFAEEVATQTPAHLLLAGPSATGVGGIQDQIVTGESGILLDDPHDLPAFGRAFRTLIADPALADRLGKAAKARASELFLADTHLERWAELVKTLVQENC